MIALQRPFLTCRADRSPCPGNSFDIQDISAELSAGRMTSLGTFYAEDILLCVLGWDGARRRGNGRPRSGLTRLFLSP
jgi:hypothetical protein